MSEEAIKIGGKKKSIFKDKVMALLPEGGNLNLCLTCGACSSGLPGHGPGKHGPAQIAAHGRPGHGRGASELRLGLDVHHVPALHLCLPDENRHPPADLQRAQQLAPGNAAQGYPGLLRHGPAQRHLQRHGRHRGGLALRGRGRGRGGSRKPARISKTCRPPWTKRGPTFSSTRTPGSR